MMENEQPSCIVLASPGTGKTTAISKKVCEMIENGADPSEILCLTFTVKASENMRAKITEVADRKGIPRFKSDAVNVFTFHSFALDQLPEDLHFRRIATQNILRYSILRSIYDRRPFNYNINYVAENLVPKIENAIRYVKSFGILPDQIHEDSVLEEIFTANSRNSGQRLSDKAIRVYLDFFIHAFEDYEKLKGASFMDFNDLLIEYTKIPLENRKVYSFVFVDELQDINDLQAKIIESSGNFKYLVGDRKQAIFGFQGGSLTVFNRFLRNTSYRKEFLKVNHRSTDQIIEYTSSFMMNNFPGELDDELSDMKSEGKKGENIYIDVADSPVDSALAIAMKRFMDPLNRGKTTAIITRTNDQLVQISALLDKLNVPYRSTALTSVSVMAKNDLMKFLKGLFSDKPEDILNAVFTPFSGVPLRRAFEIASELRGKNLTVENLRKRCEEFFKIRDGVSNVGNISSLFESIIIPVSVPIGRDYTLTIMSLRSSINEFMASISSPSLDELMDFLTITEDEYESESHGEGLVISTVHKAKGLEFDHVVYVPLNRRKDSSSFIDTVSAAIIKTSRDIDVSKELSMEDFRVDFVAMTRARDTLTIVTDERNRSRYYINGICEISASDIHNTTASIPRGYDEAYSLFVTGNYDDSKELLSRPNWISEEIRRHFSSLKRISFSAIEGVEYPLDYLLKNILHIPETAYPLSFGTKIHEIAEKVYKEENVELETDEMRQIHENIKAIHWSLKNVEQMEQIGAEMWLSASVSDLFGGFERYSGIQVVGVIDALFRSKNREKYLIVDYKTDMSMNNGAKHRRQLLLYKMLLSRHLSLDPEKIETAIAYLSLREPVNTGDIDFNLDKRGPSMDAMETVRKKILAFLHYVDNPNLFISSLLEKTEKSSFYGPKSALTEMIVRQLKS